MHVNDPRSLWMLPIEPRIVQVEATARAIMGVKFRNHMDDDMVPEPLHSGALTGWNHFMEMRLGKTYVNLNEFAMYNRHYNTHRMVVLSPNKFKTGWLKEIDKMLPGIPVHMHESKRNKQSFQFLERPKGIFIVNYEAIRSENILNAVTAFATGGMATADESILIKGHKSLTTKAALRIAQAARFRRNLTGKPIVQGPHDLWSQMRFIGEFNKFGYFPFRGRFCKMGGFQGKQVVGMKNEEELQRIITKNSFKARTVDWLKTPGVDYSIEKLEVSGEQFRRYNEMQKDMLIMIEEQDAVCSAEMVITKLDKLQQISSGFVFDDDRNVQWLVDPKKNPKLKWLLNKLENEIQCKVHVTCKYRPTLDLLESELAEYNPAVIRGSDDRDPEEQKAKFTNDRSCRVMLTQTRAAKYGHDLTAHPQDPCLVTIMYENTYSLDDRDQIEKRIQGGKQVARGTIIDLMVTPIDAKPIEALQRKEDVAASLMQYNRKEGILPHAE